MTEWWGAPGHARLASRLGLVALVALGLSLPPVSLPTRLTSLGYATVRPGQDAIVAGDVRGTFLRIDRLAIRRTTRIRLTAGEAAGRLPRGVDPLPGGREPFSTVWQLKIRGPVPRRAQLELPLRLAQDQQPFLDPYGWDGRRWRWLAPTFVATDRVRLQLPLSLFVPRWIVVSLASATSTELAAALLPPPATVPAAVTELPILELRAYHLGDGEGTVDGRAFALPSRTARRFGIVDNRANGQVRVDLTTNMLIRPETRQRHREAVVDLVRRDNLDGVVLDYPNLPDDLQPTYVALVRQLAADLDRHDRDLIVTVPLPRRSASTWDARGYLLRELGDAADAVRIALPADEPLALEDLEAMVRWALGSVERGRLQLGLPVQGRDMVDGEVGPISFGTALGRILDMARSDAPARLSPGSAAPVELPTIAAAAFGRDPATGMWRFHYWDGNRRQHTVWLNDASGLEPAFAIAAQFRLGRVVLDGVEAGLDPDVWAMTRTYLRQRRVEAPPSDYRLLWQLTDDRGQVVQQALQPVGESTFTVRAPQEQGRYWLSVNLASGNRTVALGSALPLAVAPPPPPTPAATAIQILIPPTPVPYATAPPPADEVARERTPVRMARPAVTRTPSPFEARLASATAQLRAGPGTAFDSLSDLRAGDVLDLIGRTPDGLWLRVRVGSTGVEGWVLADLLAYDHPLRQIPVVRTPGPTPSPR